MLLHDGAVGRYDREDRLAGAVGRRAQQRRPNPAGVQGARDDLRLRRVSDNVAVRQISDIDAADRRVGSAFEGKSGRVKDAR